MPGLETLTPAVLPLILLVALAYSSVGHGGASGYLAVLALFGLAPSQMAPSALALNLLVAGTSLAAFRGAGHFEPRLFWPFAAASIPAAFLGGMLEAPPRVYAALLTAALLFAAWRLVAGRAGRVDEPVCRPPSLWVALPAGAVLGLASGLVGVGGGIFLSPLLLLAGWADAKRTAAASACFIWVNSAAGLYGHASRQGLDAASLWPLVAAAFAGGLIGSRLGARRWTGPTLRRVLAGALAVAAFKMLRVAAL